MLPEVSQTTATWVPAAAAREHDLAGHGGPARRPPVGVVDRPGDLGDGPAQFGREQDAPVDLG